MSVVEAACNLCGGFPVVAALIVRLQTLDYQVQVHAIVIER